MASTLRVSADITAHLAQAGEPVQTTITIENLNPGGVVDTYSLQVNGPRASWASLGTQVVRMFPGGKESTEVTILPPRASSSVADTYEFTITATSQDNPSEQDSLSISVTVQPFYEYTASLRPTRIEGDSASFTLVLTNNGNTDMAFSLEGRDAEGLCEFQYNPSYPIVSPGAVQEVRAMVTTRPPLSGGTVSRHFTLTVSPPSGMAEPSTVFGELVVTSYNYAVDIRPRRIEGVRGDFTLLLSNNGSRELNISLEGRDDEERCRFAFDPANPIIAPNDSMEVAVAVAGKRPLRGQSITRKFDLTVSPPSDLAAPTTISGELVVPPIIPRWAPLAATLCVLAVVVAVGAYIFIQNWLALPSASTIDITDKIFLAEGETRLVRADIRDIEGNPHDYRVTWEVRSVNGDSGTGVRSIELVSDTGLVADTVSKGPQSVTVRGLKSGLANLVARVESGEGEIKDETVQVFVSPPSANRDCVGYDQASLRLIPQGENELVLTDGSSEVLVMSTSDDPLTVLKLANSHTERCIIGKRDTDLSEVRSLDRVEFWLGSTSEGGAQFNESEVSCMNYLTDTIEYANLTITADGTEPGEKLSISVQGSDDLEAILNWVRSNSRVCYISKEGEGFGSSGYLTQFWE